MRPKPGTGPPWRSMWTISSSIVRLAAAISEFGPADAVLLTIGTAHLKRVEHLTQSQWAANHADQRHRGELRHHGDGRRRYGTAASSLPCRRRQQEFLVGP